MVLSLVAPYIESLTPYVPGKPIEEVTREYGVPDPVKLASNENALGPSPLAMAAVSAALEKVNLYPDGSAFALKQGLSEKLGVPVSEIMLGNGTNELITLLARTFLAEGEEAVFSSNTFLCYRIAVQSSGRRFTEVPMHDHRADLTAMAAALTPRTRLLFLANPDNPNGTYAPQVELEKFLATVPETCTVVLDEAYFEFADAPDFPDGLTLRRRFPNLIVLRTFSKIYGLAGLRVGYGVASEQVVRYIDRVRDTFNVNSLGQVGALAALNDHAHVLRTLEMTSDGRERLMKDLPRFGFRVIPSLANFVLAEVGQNAQALFQALLPLGIILRPLGPYGMPQAMRISIGTPPEIQRLLRALEQVLAGGKDNSSAGTRSGPGRAAL
jgi:histidinol-phosphate aminotransferase